MFSFSCCRNIERENLTYLADTEGRSSNPISSDHHKLNSMAQPHPISNKICSLADGLIRGPLLAFTGLAIHRLWTVPTAFQSVFGTAEEVCSTYGASTVKQMLSSTMSQAWEMSKLAASNLSECLANRPPINVYVTNTLTVITDAVANNREIALAAVVVSTIAIIVGNNMKYQSKENDSKKWLIKDLTAQFYRLTQALKNDDLDDQKELAQGIIARKEEIKKELSSLNTLSQKEITAITKSLFHAARAITKAK